MRSLVLYDSNCGNTQKVAETIAEVLGAKVVSITKTKASELSGIDLLVVGTPIIGWMPTVKMQEFLAQLTSGQLNGVKATTFDTRVKLFIHGDAMKKVATSLRNAGAEIIIKPMAFYVAGPQNAPYLLDGEISRAKEWAKEILSSSSKVL